MPSSTVRAIVPRFEAMLSEELRGCLVEGRVEVDAVKRLTAA
jgi:hypothetical protein